MVNVGRMAGDRGEFEFDLHSLRRISYVGVTFRTRGPEEVEEVVARTARALGPALAEAALRMPIDKVHRVDSPVNTGYPLGITRKISDPPPRTPRGFFHPRPVYGGRRCK